MMRLVADGRRLVHGFTAALLLIATLIGVTHHHDEAVADARSCAVCVVASHAPAVAEPVVAVAPAATVVARVVEVDRVAAPYRAPVRVQGRAPPVSAAPQLM